MLTCEVIKAIRTDSILAAALGFVWCVCIVRVQVWSVLSLYCTGGDHHKAQTGGAIWSSLKPSPGILKWRWGGRGVWGPSMMDVSGKWTGHNHNGPTP